MDLIYKTYTITYEAKYGSQMYKNEKEAILWKQSTKKNNEVSYSKTCGAKGKIREVKRNR